MVSTAGSSLGFFREFAVLEVESRGRRGARAGFSLGSFFGLVSGSSSFFRRDRLAVPEARRALSLASIDGPSVFKTSTVGISVDIIIVTIIMNSQLDDFL